MQKVNSEITNNNNNKTTVKTTTTTTQNGGHPSKSPKISSPHKSSLSFKITNGSIGGGGGGGVGSTSTHSLIKLRKQALVSIKSKCGYFFQTAESPNIGS